MTRRVLPLLALALLLGADWPQFLGPNRDGVSTEKAIPTDWTKKPLTVLWERNVGEGYASPVVADGKLILFHRVGDRETVECLDAVTGKEQWKFASATDYRDPYGKGDGPRSTPTIVGGKVYTLGAAGLLTCLDLASGKLVWQRDLAKDYQPRESFFGVGSSPLVEGTLLISQVGDAKAGIVAWEKDTGKEVWRATDQEASYASPIAATLDGKRRVLVFAREGLVGLEPATGKVVFEKRWRSRMRASVNAATPIVRGNQILLTSSYDTGAIVLEVKQDALRTIWSGDESLSAHFSTPAIVGDFVYGFDGREEFGARLRCIEWATGKVRWTAEGYGCGSIVRVGDGLLVLRQDGTLEILEANPQRHVVRASKKVLTGPVRAHLAVADGRLFVRDNRKLVALGWKE